MFVSTKLYISIDLFTLLIFLLDDIVSNVIDEDAFDTSPFPLEADACYDVTDVLRWNFLGIAMLRRLEMMITGVKEIGCLLH